MTTDGREREPLRRARPDRENEGYALARDMVAPIWQGVEIIHDEITKAANGQIVLTAVLLHAVKILREDGFERRVVQVA